MSRTVVHFGQGLALASFHLDAILLLPWIVYLFNLKL